MKAFESPLGPLLESYISYRTSLGYGEKGLRRILLAFDRYVQGQKADLGDLNPLFFLELKKRLAKKHNTFNAMLLSVRGFFTYLVRRQIVTENPLLDIGSYTPNAFIPFVFSKEQTDALLCAAQKIIRKEDPDSFFRDFSAYMVVILLARCGMRIKEPLRLTLLDYQSTRKTLYIEKTKFHKDRLIPLPAAVARELDTYLRVRGSFVTDGNAYLFAGKNNGTLHARNVYRLFDQSVTEIGIDGKKSIIGNTSFGRPTPHSLRHSFAINTLKAVKDRGGSPQNALPVLSAYLGHVKYRYTAVYLKVLDASHRNALVDFAIARQEEI
jgi:site-specific recombinase XerD